MTQKKIAEIVKMGDDKIKEVCRLAMEAHSKCKPSLPYLSSKKSSKSSHAFFAFPGSWPVNDWFAQKSIGDSETHFPSLKTLSEILKPKGPPDPRRIDKDVFVSAAVSASFLRQFDAVLTTKFTDEVGKAVKEQKQIVFTGHSSGGALAILVTLWYLDKYLKPGTHEQKTLTPLCVTFGSPLVGDRVFGHAIRRENWSDYFVHFVMRYDIVPRILLAPLSSVEKELQKISNFFDPKSKQFKLESIAKSQEASFFFRNIMINASSVANHTACSFMVCTNTFLEAITSFIELSPYRPFGTYIFCPENKKPVTLKNPDAILQLLFYCLQSGTKEEIPEVACKSLKDHLVYETELQKNLAKPCVVELEHLEILPLSSEGCDSDEMSSIHMALNGLGLSTRARLCLRAAGEFEKQKQENKRRIDENCDEINKGLESFQAYREQCKGRDVGYYDSFKLQEKNEDFHANVKRLELAGMWDEITEMLKRYELPDNFVSEKKWIELGTNFRRLVEPLDIANFYRHDKRDDTGPYMVGGRPKRYRFTQKWLEHYNPKAGFCSESCFWAAVEELRHKTGKIGIDELKEKVLQLEKEVLDKKELLGGDVFLKNSTFVEWWKEVKKLTAHDSCIEKLMNGEGRELPIPTKMHLLGSTDTPNSSIHV